MPGRVGSDVGDPGRVHSLFPDFAEPETVESFVVSHGEDIGSTRAVKHCIKPFSDCPGDEDLPLSKSGLEFGHYRLKYMRRA